jgi:hypothetical protein
VRTRKEVDGEDEVSDQPKKKKKEGAPKRKVLTQEEELEITKQVASGKAKSFEELFKLHPEVSKVVVKKFGADLKLAGVWVPKAEKKVEKKPAKKAKTAE